MSLCVVYLPVPKHITISSAPDTAIIILFPSYSVQAVSELLHPAAKFTLAARGANPCLGVLLYLGLISGLYPPN